MECHNFDRRNLYDVRTERLLRTSFRIKVKRHFIKFWKKIYWVYEYAHYECAGRHPDYLGWFGFLEVEHTGWKKHFQTEQDADKFINQEILRRL